MNGANQNEIDLLLRTLARAEKNPSPSRTSSPGDGAAPSDHLDADELNSYAEGLVPAPARVRYTEHLADCAVCRGIVVDLTQAAGASTRLEAPASPSESSFWQKLAALFAPSVLRYAVPVLVITVVIGIGLFALRRQNENALVAKNDRVAVQPAPSENNNNLAPTNAPAPQIPGEVAAPEGSAKTEDKPKKPEVSQTPLDSVSTLEKEAPAKAAKDADEVGAGSGVADLRPLSTVQPKPEPAPPPPAVDKSGDYAFSRDKREEQERALEELKRQDEDVHGPNRARNAAPMSTAQRAVPGLARNERGPSAMNKNKGADTESRAVAGKRFTRDEGVWIDVDYQSQATTRVTRGSEQFRALVADEPGLGTIAERLDGPIIVVWKGRAYRIQ